MECVYTHLSKSKLRPCSPVTLTNTTLPLFSLLRDFGKQNTRANISKISVSLVCYWQIGLKSTNHSPIAWCREGLEGHTSGCNWWISIWSVNNTLDWRKFWKSFRRCFVWKSRVSMKTVVSYLLNTFPRGFINCYRYVINLIRKEDSAVFYPTKLWGNLMTCKEDWIYFSETFHPRMIIIYFSQCSFNVSN